MVKKAKIVENKTLEKDIESHAVLNTSRTSLEMARELKEKLKRNHEQSQITQKYIEIIEDLVKRVEALENNG